MTSSVPHDHRRRHPAPDDRRRPGVPARRLRLDAGRGAVPGRVAAGSARGVRAHAVRRPGHRVPQAQPGRDLGRHRGGRPPAGRLYVDRRPDDIRIIDIALLPEFRGRGHRRRAARAAAGEAAASGRKLSIHVEIHNRAAALYARLGFEVVDEHGLYRRMEWTAP